MDNSLNKNKEFYEQMSESKNTNNFLTVTNKTNYASQPKADTFYYNDPEKEKKKKVFKYSVLATSAIIATTALFGLRNNKHVIELIQNIPNTIQHASQEIQEKTIKPAGNAISNIMSNTINIKDDIWDKFAKKAKAHHLGFIDKIGDWITGVYKKGITSAFEEKYNTIISRFSKDEIANLGINENFQDWFGKTNKKMHETLHKEGEKVTDNLFNKDIVGKVTKSNIADGKLKDLYKEEYFEITKTMDKETKEKLEDLNKLKATLLPKMRDINCGSAPTDLLTIIMSTLGLGVATASADDKKERKSIVLNLGIPLMATLLSTTYGTIRCFSGAKSLIFGLALGQIAKIGAKTIDKATAKDKNSELV